VRIAALAIGIAAVLAHPCAEASEIRRILIGGGPAAGEGFAHAGAIARAVTSPPGLPPCRRPPCGLPGTIASAQAFADDAAATAALLEGRIAAAVVSATSWADPDIPLAAALAGHEPRLLVLLEFPGGAADHVLVVRADARDLVRDAPAILESARAAGETSAAPPGVPHTIALPDGPRVVLPRATAR